MIPQPRTLHEGAHGPDVIAVKHGLKKAGFRLSIEKDSPLFGARMKHELAAFQREEKLFPDGVFGPSSYKAMYPLFGDFALALLRRADANIQARNLRTRVVQNALWCCQSQLQPFFIYDQVRPYPVSHPFRCVDGSHEVVTDCSGFVGLIAQWSGAPSPFPSFGFDGLGNTDVMMEELPSISSTSGVLPGDLVLYSNPGHVVISIGYPRAVSFGAEPGPIPIDSRYRPFVGLRRFL